MFIICLILKKMHEFTLIRQITISNDYEFFENQYPVNTLSFSMMSALPLIDPILLRTDAGRPRFRLPLGQRPQVREGGM